MIKQYGQNDICFCDFLPHFFIFRFFHGAGALIVTLVLGGVLTVSIASDLRLLRWYKNKKKGIVLQQ